MRPGDCELGGGRVPDGCAAATAVRCLPGCLLLWLLRC